MSGSRSEDDLIEKALDNCLYHEFDEYRVIARRHDGWDAISSVLLALDRYHHDFLKRVLEHCCYAATEYIEDNGGLYNVLSSEDMLESDAAADREDRRARAGFVSPSAATSFLALARTTPLEQLVESEQRDPITHAYFRELAPLDAALVQPGDDGPGAAAAGEGTAPGDSKLVDMLRQAQVFEAPRPAQRLSDGTGQKEADGVFKRALLALRDKDPLLFSLRMEELAYLANVMLSGLSVQGRAFRLFETGDAAIAVCNLGLGYMQKRAAKRPELLLAKNTADKLFRIGWHVLHEQVSAPAARILKAAQGPHALDPEQRAVLEALRDGCPTLAPAITGTSMQTGRADTRALEFIATAEQMHTVQRWLERFEPR